MYIFKKYQDFQSETAKQNTFVRLPTSKMMNLSTLLLKSLAIQSLINSHILSETASFNKPFKRDEFPMLVLSQDGCKAVYTSAYGLIKQVVYRGVIELSRCGQSTATHRQALCNTTEILLCFVSVCVSRRRVFY